MRSFYFICILCFSGIFVQAQSRIQQSLTWSPSIGFYGDITDEYDYYDNSTEFLIGIKLDYGVAYKFNNYVSLGLSTGIRHFMVPDYVTINGDEFWSDDDDNFEKFFKLPVAANLNVRFLDKKVSPYLGVSGGYMFGLNSKNEDNGILARDAVFGNIGAGVSVRFKNGKLLQAGPVVELISTKDSGYRLSSSSFSSDKDIWQVGLNLSFGF